MQSINNAYIPKQETQILKGVAILLMLFSHLFNGIEDEVLYDNYILVGDTPLLHILSRACNPVVFFLILGGYGLYIVFKKGDNHRFTRIFRLLIHYIIITLVFVIIGLYVRPELYHDSFFKILYNIATFQATYYNSELWFLCPYLFLSLTSPWLFHLAERFKTRYVLLFLFGMNLCTSFIISRYGAQYLFANNWIYNPLLYFHLMFPLVLGAMSAKHHVFSLGADYNWKLWAWPLLILVIILRCMFRTSIIHTFYVFAFIFLFLKAKRFHIFDKILGLLGIHSMNMWMIHGWFNKYLFHDFIYGFKYPIIIFMVLVIISVICSMIINAICAPIKKLCKV